MREFMCVLSIKGFKVSVGNGCGLYGCTFPLLSPAFKKQFALTVSIKWQSTAKQSPDEPLPLQKPSKILLTSPLRPPRHILNSPQHSVPPPCLARPPSVPPGFCRAVGGPTAPVHPPGSASAAPSCSRGHGGSAASPVMLLHKACEATGVGQPLYEMYYSHAGPDGFLYFTYKVCIPGITAAFEGLVMILPGPTATTTLEEARRVAAQQVLQTVYNNQFAH